MMNKDFLDKTAVITGGSRGIGRQMCLDFAARGTTVAFCYKEHQDDADSLVRTITESGGKCMAYKASVESSAEINDMIKDIISQEKRIDILINNAGIMRTGPLAGMHHNDWKQMININLNGMYRCTKAVFPYLIKTKGSIINISSYMAFRPNGGGQAVYSATKAAIVGFTRALASEAGRAGIRVNAIAPGLINTDILSGLQEKTKESIINNTILKKMGEANCISQMACILAGPEGSYITGQTYIVDGGGVRGQF